MSEAITVARPYAQAAFLHARGEEALTDWSDMLSLLAGIADDAAMRELIDSPHVTETQLADLFVRIAGDRINGKCANFTRILAANGRLRLLPEIAALYEIQRRAAEGSVQAELVSAFPASEAQQADVIASLRKRLGRDIELRCTTDTDLLGGAIIRAGDLVIDGSVRGKLERLGASLMH